jgi:hypothetical protein
MLVRKSGRGNDSIFEKPAEYDLPILTHTWGAEINA